MTEITKSEDEFFKRLQLRFHTVGLTFGPCFKGGEAEQREFRSGIAGALRLCSHRMADLEAVADQSEMLEAARAYLDQLPLSATGANVDTLRRLLSDRVAALEYLAKIARAKR